MQREERNKSFKFAVPTSIAGTVILQKVYIRIYYFRARKDPGII